MVLEGGAAGLSVFVPLPSAANGRNARRSIELTPVSVAAISSSLSLTAFSHTGENPGAFWLRMRMARS